MRKQVAECLGAPLELQTSEACEREKKWPAPLSMRATNSPTRNEKVPTTLGRHLLRGPDSARPLACRPTKRPASRLGLVDKCC